MITKNTKKTFAVDTSKRTIVQWVEGLVVLFAGLTIAHLGVSLFLVSNLGTDTFTILVQGVANLTPLTIGTCHVITLVLLMLVMVLTTKNYIKPGTVVCAFCGGWIIDFFLWILNGRISLASPMWVRVLVMVLGCIILSFGMSMVIESNSGTGPNDLIAIILTDKLKRKWSRIQFRYVRMTCDVLFTFIGYKLGGVFGVGTVTAAILIGPIVQLFLPVSRRMIHTVFPRLDE